MPPPEDSSTSPLVRRRRMRHEWSEASNPHDLLAARAGWATAILILLAGAWLVARNAGWI
ncbi:MAG: hypothetical protein ACK5TH_12525 [Prosthecobacter sp.]